MNGSNSCIAGAAAVLLALVCGLTAAAGESGPTAREEALFEWVQALEKRVTELEQQLRKRPEASSSLLDQGDAPTKTERDTGEDAGRAANDFRVYWQEGLCFETEDQRFRLRVGGRIQNDWAFFDQDRSLERVFGDEEDGTEFRRARIDLQGQIYSNVSYRTEYDFAGDTGEGKFYDVYLGITDLPAVGNLKVGHFREPFGLECLTNASHLTFMERALPNAFAPSRNVGVMIFDTALNRRATWAIGAFKEVDSFPSHDDSDEDQGFSLTARLTGLPWCTDEGRKLLHLGLAYSHRNPDGAVLGWRTRPEAHLANTYLDTEAFEGYRFRDARMDDVDLWGTEAALLYGPFSIQGEYICALVDTEFAGDRTFDGYYAQASYLLTGEHRPYEPSKGLFGRPYPKRNFLLEAPRGWGAWELALRYSNLDLDDALIRGGQEENLTLGLNWYLNPNARVMLNYVHAVISHDGYHGDLDVVQTRLQIDF